VPNKRHVAIRRDVVMQPAACFRRIHSLLRTNDLGRPTATLASRCIPLCLEMPSRTPASCPAEYKRESFGGIRPVKSGEGRLAD
jgi:hypothetical protein